MLRGVPLCVSVYFGRPDGLLICCCGIHSSGCYCELQASPLIQHSPLQLVLLFLLDQLLLLSRLLLLECRLVGVPVLLQHGSVCMTGRGSIR